MNQHRRPPSFDDVMDAFADVERRKLLVALTEHNPQDDSPAVVDAGDDADAVGRLVSMRHVHLPKLADYGFIEWDEESHEVQKGPNFEEIRPLIELLSDHEDELPEGWL